MQACLSLRPMYASCSVAGGGRPLHKGDFRRDWGNRPGARGSWWEGGQPCHLLGLPRQYGACLQGTEVPVEGGQDGSGQKENKRRSAESAGPWGKEESTFVWGGQGPRGRERRQGACQGDWKRGSGPWGLTGFKKGTLAGCRSRCPAFRRIWGNHFLISPAPLRRDLGFGREGGERGLP